MTVIDHGQWDYHTPANIKAGAPPHAMYAARASDGVDWYEYIAERPFGDASVVMTVQTLADGTEIIQAATFDYTAIFPPTFRVLEDNAYSGNDPQSDFGQRTYSADRRKIGAKYVPPPLPPTAAEQKILSALDAIVSRLEKLEKHK